MYKVLIGFIMGVLTMWIVLCWMRMDSIENTLNNKTILINTMSRN